MPPDELLQEFAIDPAPIWPVEDGRLEPVFLEEPLGAEVAEFAPLDPERSAPAPDETLSSPARCGVMTSLVSSLGVHLVALVVLIGWSSAESEIPGGIPVQLVIDEAPSVPDAVAAERPTSDSAGKPQETDNAAAPPPEPPRPVQAAEVAPPPKPDPPPVPAAAPAPAVKPLEPAVNPPPRAAPASGLELPGGDYLDYLVTLTRGHFDILPLAFLAGRHGRTTLSVVVLEDGTIGRIAVKHSSGYPDIDERIEQMVAAVGRFPPVPESFEKPSVRLDFNMTFPDALQE